MIIFKLFCLSSFYLVICQEHLKYLCWKVKSHIIHKAIIRKSMIQRRKLYTSQYILEKIQICPHFRFQYDLFPGDFSEFQDIFSHLKINYAILACVHHRLNNLWYQKFLYILPNYADSILYCIFKANTWLK